MGIGYAPNKELYTEHFLKPLRSAFSERDLQVIIDYFVNDNHDEMGTMCTYRLTWSLVRGLTVVLWAGFTAVIQVINDH